MTDITNLTGDSLWAALTSNKPITVQKTKATPPPPPPPKWTDTAIATIKVIRTCTCGSVHSILEPSLFIQSTHKDGSTRYQRVQPDRPLSILHKGLPIIIHEIQEDVTFCSSCIIFEAFNGHTIGTSLAPLPNLTDVLPIPYEPPSLGGLIQPPAEPAPSDRGLKKEKDEAEVGEAPFIHHEESTNETENQND